LETNEKRPNRVKNLDQKKVQLGTRQMKRKRRKSDKNTQGGL